MFRVVNADCPSAFGTIYSIARDAQTLRIQRLGVQLHQVAFTPRHVEDGPDIHSKRDPLPVTLRSVDAFTRASPSPILKTCPPYVRRVFLHHHGVGFTSWSKCHVPAWWMRCCLGYEPFQKHSQGIPARAYKAPTDVGCKLVWGLLLASAPAPLLGSFGIAANSTDPPRHSMVTLLPSVCLSLLQVIVRSVRS